MINRSDGVLLVSMWRRLALHIVASACIVLLVSSTFGTPKLQPETSYTWFWIEFVASFTLATLLYKFCESDDD